MKLSQNTITKQFTSILSNLSRYKLLLFIILVAAVYGYILLTISALSDAQPTDEMISAQSNPITSARIDTRVIGQLRNLEDNSVSVRELFDEARNNPFQE